MKAEDRYAAIREWVLANESRILDHLRALIAFRTVNKVTSGTEAESQEYIAALLSGMGLEVELFSPETVPDFRSHPAYYPGKDYSDRPNVVALLYGEGKGRSLLFSSHIDTAEAAQGWTSDPWTAYIRNNRLYGLGAYDMKGGLVASIMAVQCLLELGIRLKGDVTIESVVDEEFGGANGTLACRMLGREADAAIIPEPTNFAVCPASRGGALWRVTFRGTTGLSFNGETPQNPVYAASRFVSFLERFERERSRHPGPGPWYAEPDTLPVIVTRLAAGSMEAPLNDAGPTTCSVDVWVECYPGVSEDDLLEELLEAYKRDTGDDLHSSTPFAPQFDKMIRFLPGAEMAADHPLLPVLSFEAERVTGVQTPMKGAPFACDAFMFNLHSRTPAVICGPSGGNAHAPDEYVDIPQLMRLVELYAKTMMQWCGVHEQNRN
ncbi:MAG: M20/M25/M40 family metallo-hydrolase [Paenibacillaceae bacterium]|nr:M20/M25/M40 family metallo-hydrolase [Paenibacillaceae bacterium]